MSSLCVPGQVDAVAPTSATRRSQSGRLSSGCELVLSCFCRDMFVVCCWTGTSPGRRRQRIGFGAKSRSWTSDDFLGSSFYVLEAEEVMVTASDQSLLFLLCSLLSLLGPGFLGKQPHCRWDLFATTSRAIGPVFFFRRVRGASCLRPKVRKAKPARTRRPPSRPKRPRSRPRRPQEAKMKRFRSLPPLEPPQRASPLGFRVFSFGREASVRWLPGPQ